MEIMINVDVSHRSPLRDIGLAKPFKKSSENNNSPYLKLRLEETYQLANPTFPKNSLGEMHTITMKQLMRLNK